MLKEEREESFGPDPLRTRSPKPRCACLGHDSLELQGT